jgi:hypothetical protein
MIKIYHMRLDIYKLNTLKIISYFFIIFFLSSPSSFANYKLIKINKECQNNNDNFFNNLDYLEIKINKNKDFVKKILNSILRNNVNVDKKKYKSEIKLNFKNSKTCVLEAKIRLHGDYADHVDLIDGYPISSMHVNLVDQNIENNISFKLFLPRTRNYFNEIFITSFFRNIGFLAPKTNLIKVKYMDKFHYMLFQEHIAKEFLEKNNLVESFIIEGHDKNLSHRLGGNPAINRMAKISNSKFIIKDKDNLYSAYDALTSMNQVYLNNNLIKHEKSKKFEDLIFINNSKTLNKKNFERKNTIFEILMRAMSASHGLSQEDRVFYYDPHYKDFMPIYYDGGASLLYPNEKIKPNQNFDISSKKGFKLLEIDNLLENKKIINLNKHYIDESISYIDKIDNKKFILDLKNSGMNISENELKKILNFIKLQVQKFKMIGDLEVYDFEYKPYYSLFEYRYNVNLAFFEKGHFIICDANSVDESACKKEQLKNINNNSIRKLLSQDLTDKENKEEIVFVSNSINNYFNGEYNFVLNHKKISIENFNILSFNGGGIKINKIEKSIQLISIEKNQRFLIYGKEINNWKFEYLEKFNHSELGKMNLFTGCVTILDIKLNEVSIKSKKSSCEDAYNLIRTTGIVNKVEIENSISDGLDADFSNLYINELNIKNTNNDCLDFSYGNYNIKKSVLVNCGDKGISIGEKSDFYSNESFIYNANTALAIKDSSNGNVKNFNAENVENCISAYNKKQEFFGGKIMIDNFKCINYQNELTHDESSEIKIINKL